MKQLAFLKSGRREHGGELRKRRKGRGARPIDTKNTMHLVLRSSKAKGPWSFRRPRNERRLKTILEKFSTRFAVRILSFANVGNHLHLQIKLGNRHTYRPFIRAVTAAIAMAVTGASRWKKVEGKFWDLRPFTRIVVGWRAVLTLRDYIAVNRLEGHGYDRELAKFILRERRAAPS